MGGVINCFYLLSARSTSLPQHRPFPASASTRRNRLKETRLGFHGVVSSLFTLICSRPATTATTNPPWCFLSLVSLSLSLFLTCLFLFAEIILYYYRAAQPWSKRCVLHDDTECCVSLRGEINFWINIARSYHDHSRFSCNFNVKANKNLQIIYRKRLIISKIFFSENN